MTNKDYDLNLWERNSVQIPAVQGESNSRTINFHLKEEVSVQDALGNLAIRQKPVDLTGCNVRLYFLKPDSTKVFSDGTVSDATNGITTFTLPYQATTADGLSKGQILISKPDDTTLKAIGIELQTNPSDLDGAIESTNDFSALVTALNKADTAAATATHAAEESQIAVQQSGQAITDANAAKNTALAAAANADTAAAQARQAAQDALNSHSMISPVTHYTEAITKVIDDVYASILALGSGAPTAAEYAALGLTAEQYAAKHITAAQYAINGKALLGG